MGQRRPRCLHSAGSGAIRGICVGAIRCGAGADICRRRWGQPFAERLKPGAVRVDPPCPSLQVWLGHVKLFLIRLLLLELCRRVTGGRIRSSDT